MKSRNCKTLLLLSWIFFSLSTTVHAADGSASQGQVTAGINLRAAPGLSGKVITGLEAGTVVVVTGEQAGWYQIAYENETYGYRGWVYGKYIELLAVPAAPPLTPLERQAAPRPIPVSSQPPLPAQSLRSEVADRAPDNLAAKMPANTIELIQAAARPEPAALDQVATEPAAADGPTTSAKVTSEPAAQPVTVRAKTDIKPVPARVKSAYPGPVPEYLLSIVLKISSVFLSCLALLISYRTFQIVTATGRTT